MKIEEIETLAVKKFKEHRIVSRLESVKKHQKKVCDWLMKYIDTNHEDKPRMWAELFKAEEAERRMINWYIFKFTGQ